MSGHGDGCQCYMCAHGRMQPLAPPRVCEHGNLARQCETCERDGEIAALTARVEAAERIADDALADALDLRIGLEEARAAIDGLLPYLMEDHNAGCPTRAYNAAIEAARRAVGAMGQPDPHRRHDGAQPPQVPMQRPRTLHAPPARQDARPRQTPAPQGDRQPEAAKNDDSGGQGGAEI